MYVGQSITTVSASNKIPFNGGGYSAYENPNQPSQTLYGGSGGGSTDIRTTSGAYDNAASLRSRIAVAAGGGGAGIYGNTGNTGCIALGSNKGLSGAHAGGLSGYNGPYYQVYNNGSGGMYSTGGTQVSGGTSVYTGNYADAGFGYGGISETGGGSGWYGGGGNRHCFPGGSGGSSYISGHTGSVAVTSTSSSSPKSGCTTGTTNNACSISPYTNPTTNVGYIFTSTVMIDGAGYKWTNTKGALQAMPNPSGGNYASGVGHSGNGYARITYLGT